MGRHCLYAIEVDGEVRYIGQSVDPADRFRGHLREARGRCQGLFYRKLRAALAAGASIRLQVIAGELTRAEADDTERVLIALLGGHVRRGRQLWNTAEGGLGGASGNAPALLREKWRTDTAFREKVRRLASDQLRAQRADPEFERRRVEAVKARQKSDAGLQQLAAARAAVDRGKQRAAAGATLKRLWADPAYRERHGLISRENALRLNARRATGAR